VVAQQHWSTRGGIAADAIGITLPSATSIAIIRPTNFILEDDRTHHVVCPVTPSRPSEKQRIIQTSSLVREVDTGGFKWDTANKVFVKKPPPVSSPIYIISPLRRAGLRWAAGIALSLSVAWAAPVHAVDLNEDGLNDVWQAMFATGSLSPDDDADGDLQSNRAESNAGTDPRAPASVFHVSSTQTPGADLIVRWSSVVGKAYRVLSSTTLAEGSWTPVSSFVPATEIETEFRVPGVAGTSRFFRVEVTDIDSDGDGLSDWDESQLPGYDAQRSQSIQAGVSDLASFSSMWGNGTVTASVAAPVPTAIEKEGVDGVFRITRTGGLQAVTVHYTLSGDSNVQRGSAAAGDYVLQTDGGQPLSASVTIPFGAAYVDVKVRPVADIWIESPETLTLTISNNPSYAVSGNSVAAVTITDAANTAANERLFVAYLVPVSGSSATGIATVRLQGDNATGLVGLSFSGLTTPQTTSFLDLNNGGTGTYVKGLPMGQVTSNSWPIKAAAFLSTDQATLNALHAGEVSLVVNTTAFLEGEIRGNFLPAQGSTEPPEPGAPQPIETLAGDALKADVSRFLTQATFGPTNADIAALVTRVDVAHGGNRIAAYEAWIDEQLALEQTSLEAYARAADSEEWSLRGTDPINYTSTTGEPFSSNRRRAWWLVSSSAHDQLRQRIGFALSQIFVVSEKNTEVDSRHYASAKYYDQLSAAATGNFRELIETISKSPIMGTYLSHLKNQKAVIDSKTGATLISPDENYAREIMQLFSIGLVALHPDGSLKLDGAGAPVPTYTNEDITNLARVFTGWSFARRHGNKADGYPEQENTSFLQSGGPRYFQASWTNPMKNFDTYHDTGSKVVLGQAIPAGLNGEQDLDAALDILFQHENTPTFISRLLIQRLVTSNPSAGYIRRVGSVFANNGSGVRGDLRSVIKAILLDPEARNMTSAGNVGFGKQKEPIVRYLQLLRAFAAYSQLPLASLSSFGYPAAQLAHFAPGATRMRFSNTDTSLSQTPISSPTVFNWFLPGYSPGGSIAAAGLVAPEMQLANETSVVQAINFHRTLLNTTTGQGGTSLFGATIRTLEYVRVSRLPWEQLYTSEIAAGKTITQAVTTIVDRLDDLLMAGRLRAKYASAPLPNPRASIIAAGVNPSNATTSDRIINLLYLVSNSPEFLHQK